MSKGLIKHTSISLRPGQKLVDFIKGLNDTEIELTENILKVYRGFTNDQCSRKTSNDEIVGPQITKNENDYLKKLNAGNGQDELQKCMAELLIDQSSGESSENEEIETVGDDETSSKNEVRRKRAKQREMERAKLTLNLNDMKWLNNHLIERRRNGAETVYLHELLEGSKLILPKNEIIERNPELEARCQRLKREQDERSYQTMTRNVDCSRTKAPDDSIGYQIKQINRQLVAVLQFIFSVAAGFAFGFIGVELIIGNLDFGFRLLLGVICALVIALAEIYFLAKKLNEDIDYAEAHENFLKSKTPRENMKHPIDASTKEHTD